MGQPGQMVGVPVDAVVDRVSRAWAKRGYNGARAREFASIAIRSPRALALLDLLIQPTREVVL